MPGKKIFIVDDDPDMVEALRLPLEATGYYVSHATCGKEALEKIAEVDPDLVILDVMMETDTAGFQTAYQLHDQSADSPYASYAKTPILMLTAIGAEKNMSFSPETDASFLPVDAFLEKPVRPNVLLEQVASLLEGGENTVQSATGIPA